MAEELKQDDVCRVCRKDVDDELVLLCDGCPRAFHTYCVNGCTCCKKKPNLFGRIPDIPEGDFFCKFCTGHTTTLGEHEKPLSLVYAFGCNEGGQLGLGEEGSDSNKHTPTLVDDLQGVEVVDMSCGGYNTVVLTSHSEVYCCGDGQHGKTGNVNVVHEFMTKFRLVEKLEDHQRSKGEGDIVRVVCGRDSLTALSEEGHMYTWGHGEEGKLGHQDMGDKKQPTKISALRELEFEVYPKLVALGWSHTLAISSTGTLMAWGGNSAGQLGTSDYRSKWVPQVLNPSDPELTEMCYYTKPKEPFPLERRGLAEICAGRQHSIGLTKNGGVWTWGGASCGQLGHGKKQAVTEQEEFFGRLYENLTQPKLLAGVLANVCVQQVYTGDDHCFAVSATHAVYGWGKNEAGQLGLGDTTQRWQPELVSALSSLEGGGHVVAMAAGQSHSLALSSDSKVFAWGRGREGQLGLGHFNDVDVPTLVTIPANTEKIVSAKLIAGGHHTFVVMKTSNKNMRERKVVVEEVKEPPKKKAKTSKKAAPKKKAPAKKSAKKSKAKGKKK